MLAFIGARARRLCSLILLAAFVATGQGVAALELAWHVGHVDDQHERVPHVEAAGGASHGDTCQLTVAQSDGRLPVLASKAPARPQSGGSVQVPALEGFLGACQVPPTQSRAPPIIG